MIRALFLLPFLLTGGCAREPAPRPVATFSIVAFDPSSGDLGVAVQSKFFGVGSVVPWAKANVGAVATQAWANATWGPEGLKLLAAGKSARQAVEILTAADAGRERRQVGIVDARGGSAAFTGTGCFPWAGHRVGEHYCVQGNILAGEKVVTGMARAFEEERKKEGTELADWLMAALVAGQEAGGDRRGRQSAALLVVREGGGYMGQNDRFVDLRVEDHKEPIRELARLLAIHKGIRKYLRPPARIENPVIGKVPEGKELIGTKSPSLDGVRWIDGKEHPLAEVRGKVVLVRWWTDGCALCSNSARAIGALKEKYGDELVVRAIYHDKKRGREVGPEQVAAFAKKAGYPWLVGNDEGWRALRRWWLEGQNRSFTSVTFLIDRRGVIRALHSGGEFHDRKHVPDESCLFRPEQCAAEHAALDRAIALLVAEKGR